MKAGAGQRGGVAPADPRGLQARRAAAAVVATTLARDQTLDEALARNRCDDDSLARAIAVTTFRRFGTIRAALAMRLEKGLPEDPAILSILATGAAQVLFLEVADHAAVDLSVRLAQAGPRTRHLAGLVNAILRRLARERDAILAGSPPAQDLPDWLAERWRGRYGSDRTDAIAAVHRQGGALDITPRTDPALWAERLGGVLLPTGSIRITDRRGVAELPGFTDGAWWVQDAAAALPARLLEAEPGSRVLDLCAAPGGKTAQLAATGAHVTAIDRSAPRLERLVENMKRLGLAVDIGCGDALRYEAEPFDAVLLDAPCTATGTIRRHPDIAWTKGPADLAGLVALQERLFDHAAGLVRPGGQLCYCVCSLEPEEGERQAERFLARHPGFRRRPLEPGRHGIDRALVTEAGDLRTVPDLWAEAPDGAPDGWRPGLDGFYAVHLVRDPA